MGLPRHAPLQDWDMLYLYYGDPGGARGTLECTYTRRHAGHACETYIPGPPHREMKTPV